VDKTVPFAAKIPEADDVAVVNTVGYWTHLTTDDQQTWRGSVETGREAGKDTVQLSARFSNATSPESYSVMLKFKV